MILLDELQVHPEDFVTEAAIDRRQDSEWNSDTREFKDQFDLYNEQVCAGMIDDIIRWTEKDIDSSPEKEDTKKTTFLDPIYQQAYNRANSNCNKTATVKTASECVARKLEPRWKTVEGPLTTTPNPPVVVMVQDDDSLSAMTKSMETNESHKTGNMTDSKLNNVQAAFIKELQEQKITMQKAHLVEMEKLKAKMKAQELIAQQEMMASLKAEFSSQLTISLPTIPNLLLRQTLAQVKVPITLKGFPRPPRQCQEDQRKNNEHTTNPCGNHYKNTGVWGHHTWKKQEDTIWILFQNCGRLGDVKKEKNSPKLELLKALILNHEVGAIGLAQVNTEWRKVPTAQNLWTRTDGWFRN